MNKRQNTSGPQFRADRPQEQEAVRTTIVGGRPPGSGKSLGEIPRGIEVLVKKAAVDAQFKMLLLEKRADAAEAIGLALDPAEMMMLAAVPAAQLEMIIAQTDVPDGQRRAFLGRVAAAMLAAMGLASPGCGGSDVAGIRPDDDGPQKGTSSDVKRREHRDGFTGGAQPDGPRPPIERPERVEPSHGDRPPPPDEGGPADDAQRQTEPPPDTSGDRPDRLPVTEGIRPDRLPAPTGSRPDRERTKP